MIGNNFLHNYHHNVINVPQEKKVFLAVFHRPLQLDSVELFMKWGNVFSIWHLHTEQTFGQPNCNMFCWHRICVSGHLLIHWSATFFSFQVKSSHMAPSLDTVTNIFHDNASVNFHLPVCLLYSECVLPPSWGDSQLLTQSSDHYTQSVKL